MEKEKNKKKKEKENYKEWKKSEGGRNKKLRMEDKNNSLWLEMGMFSLIWEWRMKITTYD